MLSGLPLDLGPWALLGIFVLLVLTGAIPTRRELRDSQDREQKAMDLADKWQKVATEHGMVLNQILDSVEAINAVVSAIQLGLEQEPPK